MAITGAAYPRKIQIAPDSSGSAGAYADLGGQLKFDLDDMLESVDTTQMNSAGVKARIQTLLDAGVSLEYLYDSADVAQGGIRTAKSTRVQCWVKIFFTATTGYLLPMLVKNIKTPFDPAAVVKSTVTLEGAGTAIATF